MDYARNQGNITKKTQVKDEITSKFNLRVYTPSFSNWLVHELC